MERKKSGSTNKSSERVEKPVRYRDARGDATVKSISKRIEKDYGLPAGSVSIKNPGGRKSRSDSTIGSLRKRWDD